MDFKYDGGLGKGGPVTLFINDKKVGEGRIDKTCFSRFGAESFDVGMDNGSPVSESYEAPFPFSGTIKRVDIDIAPSVPGAQAIAKRSAPPSSAQRWEPSRPARDNHMKAGGQLVGLLFLTSVLPTVVLAQTILKGDGAKPNIVFILVDNVGYGVPSLQRWHPRHTHAFGSTSWRRRGCG